MNYKFIKNSQGRLCPSLDFIPEGWKELKYSCTAPTGYTWYYNGKPFFSKEHQSALIKIA